MLVMRMRLNRMSNGDAILSICVCMVVNVCMHVCMYVFIYLYIYGFTYVCM